MHVYDTLKDGFKIFLRDVRAFIKLMKKLFRRK